MCVCCEANGCVVPAKVVDHVEPHKGDKAKFWASTNWQPLCEWCHNNIKASVEAAWLAGRLPGDALRLGREVAGWVHPASR